MRGPEQLATRAEQQCNVAIALNHTISEETRNAFYKRGFLMTQPNTSPRQAASTVTVPAPQAGQTVEVASAAAGGNIILCFDPSGVSCSRDGDHLVFDTPEGQVLLTDFFAIGEESPLPSLTLPSGIRVAAADFLGEHHPDMNLATTVGTSNNVIPSRTQHGNEMDSPSDILSSGTKFESDAGSLINGIHRLGRLETFWWNRSPEPTEIQRGLAGHPDSGQGADPGPRFAHISLAAHEDARPAQHQSTAAAVKSDYARLDLSGLAIAEGTIDSIDVKGLVPGTVVYFGDPDGMNSVTVPPPSGNGAPFVLPLTAAEIGGEIFIVPPNDFSGKMNITTEITFVDAAGDTHTMPGPDGTFAVYAVADKPYGLDADPLTTAFSGTSGEDMFTSNYANGLRTNTAAMQEAVVDVATAIGVDVKVTFGDLDGSESHYILIQQHDDLKLGPLPAGYSVSPEQTVTVEGVVYIKILVDDGVALDGTGTAEARFVFLANAGVTLDPAYALKVGGYAQDSEQNGVVDPAGTDNNIAYDIKDLGLVNTVGIDYVNANIKLSVGWASETNDNSQHKSGSYTPNFNAMDGNVGVASSSTSANGAPINLQLTNPGTNECINKVTFAVPAGTAGSFCRGGTTILDGTSTTSGGTTYTFAVTGETVTVTVTGTPVANLDALGLTFKPSGHSDSDITLDYTVVAGNTVGSTATFSGTTEIVVDAVATAGVVNGVAPVYTEKNDAGTLLTASKPGEPVRFGVTAKFDDMDGSESHSVYVCVGADIPGGNPLNHLTSDYADITLSDTQINALKTAGGSDFDVNKKYIEIPLDDCPLDGSPYTPFADHTEIVVTYNAGTNQYSINGITVVVPESAITAHGSAQGSDLSLSSDIIAHSYEKETTAGSVIADGDGNAVNNEHDLQNNHAFVKGSVGFKVATASSGATFTLSGDNAFENNQPENYLGVGGAPYAQAGGNDTTEDVGAKLSISWKPVDKEYVSKIIVKIPSLDLEYEGHTEENFGDLVGDIFYKGQKLIPDEDGNVTITFKSSDAVTALTSGQLVFVPTGHTAGQVDLVVKAEITDITSNHATVKDAGSITVKVDAVANRSGEVEQVLHEDDATVREAYGKHDFNDGVFVTIKTSFTDNDGSEDHFVLIEEKTGWKSAFESETYGLTGPSDPGIPYFKIPVPTLDDLTADQRAALEAGSTTTKIIVNGQDVGEVTITLATPGDLSSEWKVTVTAQMQPKDESILAQEGRVEFKSGSVAEELKINQNMESTDPLHANNNTAMRPGGVVAIIVDNAEGIAIKVGHLYEAGHIPDGSNPEITAPDPTVTITPSDGGTTDSLFGNLTISIPAGHGTLYYNDMALVSGTSTAYNDGNVSGTLTVDEHGVVTFTPSAANPEYKEITLQVKLASDDHSDADIPVTVVGNVVNDLSGNTVTGTTSEQGIIVDAVGFEPAVTVGAKIKEGEDTSITLGSSDNTVHAMLTVDFVDSADNSEAHFILLESREGLQYTVGNQSNSDWLTVRIPDVDGKLYFKVPVPGTADGTTWLSVDDTVKVNVAITVVSNLAATNDSSELKYGGRVEDAMGSIPGAGFKAGEELSFHNNIANNVDGKLEITIYEDPGQGPYGYVVVSECHTPNAHVGTLTPETYTLNFSAAGGTSIEFNVPTGCTITVGNTVYTSGQPVTLSSAQYNSAVFSLPPGSTSDGDFRITYTINGREGVTSGVLDIFVDAVAQQSGAVTANHVVDTAGMEASFGDTAKVAVTVAGFDKTDVNTTNYVLIEAQPGWECKNTGSVAVTHEGKTYFRIPVENSAIDDNGSATVTLELNIPEGDCTTALLYGSMVVDKPTDQERNFDNNIAVKMGDGPVTIVKNVVETTLTLSTTVGHEDTREFAEIAKISIGNVDVDDIVTELHFTVNPTEGVFLFYYGSTTYTLAVGSLTLGTLTFTLDGVGKLTITSIAANGAIDLTALNGSLGVAPANGNYSSADIEVKWSYTLENTKSGQVLSYPESGDLSHTAVVDAVAHAPVVDNFAIGYATEGATAAGPQESIVLSGDITFIHVAGETGFALVQYIPGWNVDAVTLTIGGETRTFNSSEVKACQLFQPAGSDSVFYKLPLPDFTAPNNGQTYTVAVEATISLADSITTCERELAIGGVAYDSYDDLEDTLSNNVAFATQGKQGEHGIVVEAVDTTALTIPAVTMAEDDGSAPIAISVNEGEKVTSLTITVPTSGNIWYNGAEMAAEGNKVTITDFDSSKALAFKPNPDWSGSYNIAITATVQDEKSLLTKDVTGSAKGTYTPVVDLEPSIAMTPTAFDAEGGLLTVSLDATFGGHVDADGSETLSILVKVPAGMTLLGDYTTVTNPVEGLSGTYCIIEQTSQPDGQPLHHDLQVEIDRNVWDGTSSLECAALVKDGSVASAASNTPDLSQFTPLVAGLGVTESEGEGFMASTDAFAPTSFSLLGGEITGTVPLTVPTLALDEEIAPSGVETIATGQSFGGIESAMNIPTGDESIVAASAGDVLTVGSLLLTDPGKESVDVLLGESDTGIGDVQDDNGGVVTISGVSTAHEGEDQAMLLQILTNTAN